MDMNLVPTGLNERGYQAVRDFINQVGMAPEEWSSRAPQRLFEGLNAYFHSNPDNAVDPIAIIEIGAADTVSGNPETFWLMADMVDWGM